MLVSTFIHLFKIFLFTSSILQCHPRKLQGGLTSIYGAECSKGLPVWKLMASSTVWETVLKYFFDDTLASISPSLWISCDWDVGPPVLIFFLLFSIRLFSLLSGSFLWFYLSSLSIIFKFLPIGILISSFSYLILNLYELKNFKSSYIPFTLLSLMSTMYTNTVQLAKPEN